MSSRVEHRKYWRLVAEGSHLGGETFAVRMHGHSKRAAARTVPTTSVLNALEWPENVESYHDAE